MAQCKDCKHYKPIDETKGDCFGHKVPATLEDCIYTINWKSDP